MTPGTEAAPVEVEWQFDALDLRPVVRWLEAVQIGSVSAAAHRGAERDQGAEEDQRAEGDQRAEEDPGAEEDQGRIGEAQKSRAVVAEPGRARRHVDAYLDTADWRVARSGYVLRVRTRAGRREATLKDRTEATAGLRRRMEVTEPLSPEGIDTLGDDGPVGWRIAALTGTRPLQQLLEVRTRRRPYALRVGTEVVGEVALDETVIAVGDGQEPVRLRRVEVEVGAAWTEALAPMVEELRTACGLQPATLSKFEAGLLGAGLRVPGPPDLGPTEPGPDPAVGDLAYAVLRRNLGAMLEHEPGTRLGEDIEALHDMRVATRRLRAALDLFSDALPVRAKALRAEFGWLAQVLGAVRDLDVQLERLGGWIAAGPAEDRVPLEHLGSVLHEERDDARKALLSALESSRYERLVAGATALLRQGPMRRSAATRVPALAVAPELVRARHASALKGARRARKSGLATDYHRLRIRCKRLRYALEFTAGLYGRTSGPVIRRVTRLQDTLGSMQDAEVAAGRLRSLVEERAQQLEPGTVFAMGAVAERYRADAERLLARLPKELPALGGAEWRRLSGQMERRRLELGTLYAWPGGGRLRPAPAPPASGVPGQDAVGAENTGPAANPPGATTSGGATSGGATSGDATSVGATSGDATLGGATSGGSPGAAPAGTPRQPGPSHPSHPSHPPARTVGSDQTRAAPAPAPPRPAVHPSAGMPTTFPASLPGSRPPTRPSAAIDVTGSVGGDTAKTSNGSADSAIPLPPLSGDPLRPEPLASEPLPSERLLAERTHAERLQADRYPSDRHPADGA